MKKIITYLTGAWLTIISFAMSHSKQIYTGAAIVGSITANAQFTQTYSWPDSACLYFGNFKGKLLAAQKDSIGLTNQDYYKIFSPFYLPAARTTTVSPAKLLYIDPSTKEVLQANMPSSASMSITSTSTLITISGSAPNYSITAKRQEKYTGTTSASGTYTVNFATAYSTTPDIQASWVGALDNQNLRITSVSTTGFTVLARNRVDVVGLLPTWNNVSGATINVIITER